MRRSYTKNSYSRLNRTQYIRRLSRPVYEEDYVALRQELDGAIADARELMINATEDPVCGSLREENKT